ncbi:MAG: ABC transporter permease [Planctomycetes bacterium]|nr:ABC transporter permease [Planctomycetota bacterium]
MGRIWAVAVNTIRQILRLKIATAFIVILFVLLPVMGFGMTGDGTLKGRLQSFVSYGLSLTSLLLCLLTIIASIYTLTSDIKNKQIYTVITKPIKRSQLIAGKLVGVVLLSSVILVFFSCLIYSIAVYMPKFLNSSEQEIVKAKDEFYTARASVKPRQQDVTKEVEREYEKLAKSGMLEEVFKNDSKQQIIAQLRRQKKLEKRSASVGSQILWEFYNVKPTVGSEDIFIKFKYDVSVTPADNQIFGGWMIGDNRKPVKEIDTEVYNLRQKNSIGTAHEIKIPADAVAEDGYLAVAFFNLPLNNTVVMFSPKDGMEILYKADSFFANFIRVALLIEVRIIFLAVTGLLASTFLSMPVAILVCIVVFFTGSISQFIIESFGYLGESVIGFYQYILKPLIQFMPQFDKMEPASFIVPAKILSWFELAKVASVMVCIKSLVLLSIALLVFGSREIARIIV